MFQYTALLQLGLAQLVLKERPHKIFTRHTGEKGTAGCFTTSRLLSYLDANFSHQALTREVLRIPEKHFLAGQQVCKTGKPSAAPNLPSDAGRALTWTDSSSVGEELSGCRQRGPGEWDSLRCSKPGSLLPPWLPPLLGR